MQSASWLINYTDAIEARRDTHAPGQAEPWDKPPSSVIISLSTRFYPSETRYKFELIGDVHPFSFLSPGPPPPLENHFRKVFFRGVLGSGCGKGPTPVLSTILTSTGFPLYES